jgi:hypothetical protein
MKPLNMKLLKAKFLQISLPLFAVLLVIFLSIIFIKKNQESVTPPVTGVDSNAGNTDTSNPTTTNNPSATPDKAAVQNTSTCKPYVTAKKDDHYKGILVDWTTCASKEFQLYKVIRSVTNSSPSYPNDPTVSTSSNRSEANFVDKLVAPNMKYYYRVCVIEPINNVRCGNVVSVTY